MTDEKKSEKPVHDRVKGLRSQSVDRQARIAVVLMALMPALSFFYMGMTVADTVRFHPLIPFAVMACTGVAVASGWLILRKYSRNIVRLRRYVVDIASGTLQEPVHLYQAAESDDLMCIEQGLNIILQELETRIRLIEKKLKVESGLRKTLERQQQALLQAERHRVMLQSLGAACHHLGQPATALRLRLHLSRERARTIDELNEIDASMRDVEAIEIILKKLREVNEYRTEPYLNSGAADGSRILAI
jgi:signal transduction histidine kinase